MTSPVGGIGSLGAAFGVGAPSAARATTSPVAAFPALEPGGAVGAGTGVTGAAPSGGAIPALGAGEGSGGFAATLAAVFDQLQGAHRTTDRLATQAATGDLRDVHDYMIASTEAGLATEMVVTIKNKAVEAFNEIMRMPV